MAESSTESGHTFSSAGDRIAYERTGAGETGLLFVHGWCGNRFFWRRQSGPFGINHQAVTIDLAGSGASTLADAQVSLPRLAAGVVAVADALGLARVAIVGHSMGGPVGLEAADMLGERCALVVGADTFTDPYFYARRAADEIEARCAVFETDFPGAMRAMVDRITSPQPELRRWIAGQMAGVEPHSAIASLRSLLAWDVEARWPAIDCPRETINGAAMAPAATVGCLSGLEITLLDGCGHFPMLEQPERFNHLLLAALRRHGMA